MKDPKIYKISKLIQGYQVGLSDGDYVAVPDKGFKASPVKVIYSNASMLIPNWHKALLYRRFHDQYGRQGTYTLGYFKWEPTARVAARYVFDEATNTAKLVY